MFGKLSAWCQRVFVSTAMAAIAGIPCPSLQCLTCHKKSFAVIYICTRLTRESQIPFVFLGRLYHFKLLFELSTPSKRLGVKSKLDKDSLWWNCLVLWEQAKDLCWRNAVCKHRATPLLQQQHISHLKGKCSMKQCSCDRLKHFSENKYTSISFKLEICK